VPHLGLRSGQAGPWAQELEGQRLTAGRDQPGRGHGCCGHCCCGQEGAGEPPELQPPELHPPMVGKFKGRPIVEGREAGSTCLPAGMISMSGEDWLEERPTSTCWPGAWPPGYHEPAAFTPMVGMSASWPPQGLLCPI